MLSDDDTGHAVVRSTALRLIEKRIGGGEGWHRAGDRAESAGPEHGRIPAGTPRKLVMLVPV